MNKAQKIVLVVALGTLAWFLFFPPTRGNPFAGPLPFLEMSWVDWPTQAVRCLLLLVVTAFVFVCFYRPKDG